MKALPFKVPHGDKASIKVDYEKMPHFYSTYHMHEELQLMLIIKGEGTAYIGDKIVHFENGDVFFMGKNLPHVFKDNKKDEVECITIFFLAEFMGAGFLDLPESNLLAGLITESSRGLTVKGELKDSITKEIWQVYNSDGLERLLTLVTALNKIALSEEIVFLSRPGYHKPKRSIDGQKINDVFDFLMNNYSHEIKLDEVADIAHMTPTAFCRYFKHHTRKTYSLFLNEIRIGHACKMLIDDQLSISQICFNSGFNNISNFNRQFKKISGFTPSEYQKQHR